MKNKILIIILTLFISVLAELVIFDTENISSAGGIRATTTNNIISSRSSGSSDSWGPKIKLEITDNNGLKNICYFGVDARATDAWDKDIIFEFDGNQLEENEFLPPPGFTLYSYMIKDTLMEADSQSYVDFREIPNERDDFMHKFRLRVNWGNSSNITINWGEIPEGIDSAKFRSYHWYDEDEYIDMLSNTEFQTDRRSNFIKFDFVVWYNKTASIKEKQNIFIETYPNPATDYIYLDMNKYKSYIIRNLCGQILCNSLESNNMSINNSIDISGLSNGIYFIELVGASGKIFFCKLIKK